MDIIVLKAEGEALKWLPQEARVVELKCWNRGFHKFLYLWSLIRYLRKERPAALIFTDDINYSSIAKHLARVSTQVIVSSHTTLSSFLQHSPLRVRISPTAFLLKRFLWFYSWADAITPVSQGVAEDLTHIAGRPLERMQVIYNPVVTPQLFEKASEPGDHPWFAPSAPPVILGVGRLNVQKDFPSLIRAFALVRKLLPASRLGREFAYPRSLLQRFALISPFERFSHCAIEVINEFKDASFEVSFADEIGSFE